MDTRRLLFFVNIEASMSDSESPGSFCKTHTFLKYHYLHIWAVLDFDYSKASFIKADNHPPLLDAVALELDQIPPDALFQIWPAYFCTDELMRSFSDSGFKCLEFVKTQSVSKGQNLKALYPNWEVPEWYWRIVFVGLAGQDHFGLWKDMYLVISDDALTFLRRNGVDHAESNLIEMSLQEYFNSDRRKFWIR